MPKKSKNRSSSMKVKVPGAKKSVDNMKYEIANELGVNLGSSSSSKSNRNFGSEIAKKSVKNCKKRKSSKSCK